MTSKPQEIPELVRELVDMSKEYLRTEAVDPARQLGKHAGFGFGGGALFGLGSALLVLATYALARRLLPDTAWWAVGARLITFVVAGAGAGLVVWRLSDDRE